MASHGSGAVQTVYECKRCNSCYNSLYDLVSHIRAAHSGLELTCGINECTKVFFSTSTWYQHVRSAHFEDYYSKPSEQIRSSSSRFEPDSPSSPMEITDHDETAQTEAQVVEGAFTNGLCASPTQCTSTDVAAGMLIKLKEGCRLSQRAMKEVIDITNFICDHVINKAQVVVSEIGQQHHLNSTASLMLDLNAALQQISNPFTELQTTYRQHTYIAQNMPYVVSIIHLECYVKKNKSFVHFQAPLWIEIGTHIGTTSHGTDPTNLPDGFYYIPILDTLKALLTNSTIFQQVL